MSFFGTFADDCLSIRRQSPLILNITNYVAMNLTANSLLAIGASPMMSAEPLEIEELTARSSALVINLGCLEEHSIKAMELAASAASAAGIPWVLDPVGAGCSHLRTRTSLNLLRRFLPSVIRGNAGEILSLASASSGSASGLSPTASAGRASGISRGVDSLASSEAAVESAKALAQEFGVIVSVSGATDYITDGERVISIGGGSPLMPKVSAMGCTASALTGAFLAVDSDALQAAAGAMTLMKAAGSLASSSLRTPSSLRDASSQTLGESVGTLPARFLDALSLLDPATTDHLVHISPSI